MSTDYPQIAPVAAAEIGAEARLLAEEMALAAERFAKTCWENYKRPPHEFTQCPEGVDEDEFYDARRERLTTLPPENVHWWDLEQIQKLDPDLAVAKWNEIKEHARAELRLGHRGAKFVEGEMAGPMGRARFLALRQSFIDEWQPRVGVERALIDMMSQAFTMWEHWADLATNRVLYDCSTTKREEEECRRWKRPLQTEAEAVGASNDQADRWNRIFLRTLRQLRDLRRYNVNIVNAGQVNIAQQQVNVAEPPDGGNGPG